jgi:glycerophosphoryl diester phosphodiesterase
MTRPLIVARCGDLQNAPESTLPAFESAIARGADVIEFDVHLTKDDELIVHHDYYLGRTNQGSGHIGDYTLAELRALDVSSWFDAKFAGERMPTLSEVLDLGKGRIRFEIDMRSPNLTFLNRVIDEIARFGVADDVELTSAHVPLLFHVKKMNLKLCTGIFFRPLPNWMESALGQQHVIGWMSLMDAQVAHLPSSLIEEPLVQWLHKSNFLAHGSNLNTEKEIREAIMSGIDQFSTDRLELALNIRKELRRSL